MKSMGAEKKQLECPKNNVHRHYLSIFAHSCITPMEQYYLSIERDLHDFIETN